jgi:hypothetical protein
MTSLCCDHREEEPALQLASEDLDLEVEVQSRLLRVDALISTLGRA